jgi:hypothetical protein
MTEISIDFSPIHSHLNQLERHLEVVNDNLGMVDGKIEAVCEEQRITRDRVEEIVGEFRAFVAADLRAKELQRALTEIVRVRQELEKRFGRYDQVRHSTVGILQATSLELVRQNTMHEMAEELMASTARYWLPPALLALSAWIGDDRPLAERGMLEAIRRDDGKTSLFFALVCRRAGRIEAAARWLSRYFQNQNPAAIDREVVVMLDGLAYGVFGGGALSVCSATIEQWLTELEERTGFFDEQRKRWMERLDVMTPKVQDGEYPTLRYSPTAPELVAALAAARRNQVVCDYFTELFTGELVVPPRIEDAVDSLLDSLLTNFDDEELPLRREERLLQLIKQEGGDRAEAEKKFAAEVEAHDDVSSFAALLTSAAMNPEQMSATRATQRYAVSRSRHWILAAHSDLVARDRAAVPRQIELTIGSWRGSSANGSNETELLEDMGRHYVDRVAAAVDAVKLSAGSWIVLISGVLFGFLMAVGGGDAAGVLSGLVIAGAAVAFFVWRRKSLDGLRAEAEGVVEKEHDQASTFLKACLAELADYRRELAAEDAKAQNVADFLGALSAPQFILQRPEQRSSVA